jgi:single-stranded-DNA-specific exonuclease
VARARELGLTVIVTDHHLPGPELPPAQVVVNPKLAPGGPARPGRRGRVPFFLAAALNRLLPASPPT